MASLLISARIRSKGPHRVHSRPLGSDLKGGLLRHYGINYLAPTDARAITLAPGSVDMIETTNTLEHIPKDVIADIMRSAVDSLLHMASYR
jgi:hypothetical protein